MDEAIKKYLAVIETKLATDDTTEGSHRSTLEELIQSLGKGITAINEPKRVECGAPDIVVGRKFAKIGYIETKDIETDLNKVERSKQIKRYLSLPNLILTDYLEFRWYVDGERVKKARIGNISKRGKIVQDKQGTEAVGKLLSGFISHQPIPVSNPKQLALKMANLTHLMRDSIVEAFKKDKISQMLRDLRKAFATVLIPDLDQPEKTEEFANMFSQTIAYGLFAARCNHWGSEPFKRLGASSEIPHSNPFLRKLFETITGPDLVEEPYAVYVDDLVELLAHAKMGAILEHFGERTRRQDPIVHFYESFLAAYDPKVRERRGVYYTPEPVVSYIVRSVNQILKSHFDCKAGLADKSTVEYKQTKKGKDAKEAEASGPRVLVLDPACGTGTFLYAVVDHIREEFQRNQSAGLWAGYVQNHLIPRLFGFELMMAPYAMAHFKLGMQLAAQDQPELFRKMWKYEFHKGERLNIYLTNTLEETEHKIEDILGPLRVISDEAKEAAKIKEELPIMVVMGNPPYSGHSANKGKWIGSLVRDYYKVDGEPLGERNPKWLQDDYVKFIRFAQWRIENTGQGIVAMITNHGYLDNPTFRGMRQQLMNTFDEIYLLDLHGNTKKREVCPDGTRDDNVFDIQQGVSIGIFIKTSPPTPLSARGEGESKGVRCDIYHADLWGLRNGKYKTLFEKDITNTKWTRLSPKSPNYLFVPIRKKLLKEYEKGWKMSEIMPVNSVGIVTSRDQFVLGFDERALRERIDDFLDPEMSNDQAREKFLREGDKLSVEKVRKSIRDDGQWYEAFTHCLYRPFDVRPIFCHEEVIERSRKEVMRHMMCGENLGIAIGRAAQVIDPGPWNIIFCTRHITDLNLYRRGGNCLFPLYLYPDPDKNGDLFENGTERHVNFAPRFIADFEKKLGFKFIDDGEGDLKKTFGPEDVFHYMYAVFHSPAYRKRYAGFLKIDFPRVPLTSDKKLFRSLKSRGKELVGLHLMESEALNDPITKYPKPGDDEVEKVRFDEKDKRVYINNDQYFDGVPSEVWEFRIGGYQVCEKWLKDRKGRKLINEDLTHYQKIVVALKETIRLMDEIDEVITEWPIE